MKTAQDYFYRHLMLCKDMSQEQAFVIVEAEYFKVYKRHKHANYAAFRKAKSIYYQNNR